MKKRIFCLAALAALSLTIPALAAVENLPAVKPENAAVSHAPEAAPQPVVDVPVDESTYTEEPVTVHIPPKRQSGRGDVEDLEAYFEENGYPDHLSFVFEEGGELREDGTIYTYWLVGIVDLTEEQEQAILDLAAPTCLVTFENALFNHEEKVLAYDTIAALEDPNITNLIFGKNTDTVWVGVPEEMAKDYAEYLIRDLDLGAVVSVTDENSFSYLLTESAVPGQGTLNTVPTVAGEIGYDIGVLTTGVVPDAAQAENAPPLWPVLILGLAALAFVLTARTFLLPALGLAGGGTLARHTVSRKQVEQAVKENTAHPRQELYASILEKLDE